MARAPAAKPPGSPEVMQIQDKNTQPAIGRATAGAVASLPSTAVAATDIEDAAVLDAAEVQKPSGRQGSKGKSGWAEASNNARVSPPSGRPEDMVHSLSGETPDETVNKIPSVKSWKVKSWMPGSPSAAKALEEQAFKEEVENRRARDEIVTVLRKRPSVLVGLGLRADCTAREIMETLTDLHDVPDTLRRSGFNAKELAYLLHLWPRALRAVQPDQLTQTVPWRCICTLSWAFMAAAIAGLMVFTLIEYIDGWEDDGICNIRSFTNGTNCAHQPCLVNVEVRKPGSAEQYMKKSWRLPLEKDWTTGIVSITGDAFRCCNVGGSILGCCSLYDDKVFEFCDNWQHQDDAAGGICPDGKWRCMFKMADTGAGGGTEVTELKAHEPPVLWPYFASIGACVLISILVCCAPKIKRCAGRCSNCVAERLARLDMWMTKQEMVMDGNALEEGSKRKLSLAPPTTLLDTTNKAFTRKPAKERAGTLSKPRQAVQETKQAELPELPSMIVVQPAVSSPNSASTPITLPKEKEEKSNERKETPPKKEKKFGKEKEKKEDTPPKYDKFGPLKDDPVHHDLASFAQQSDNMLSIIEPLPPKNVSARSSVRSKTSGNSQQGSSRRPSADPAEGWAWANKSELVNGLRRPSEDSNTGHLRRNSQGSQPPASAEAPPRGVPTSSVRRPASMDGHVTAPQSLRVSTGSAKSSRSAKSPGGG